MAGMKHLTGGKSTWLIIIRLGSYRRKGKVSQKPQWVSDILMMWRSEKVSCHGSSQVFRNGSSRLRQSPKGCYDDGKRGKCGKCGHQLGAPVGSTRLCDRLDFSAVETLPESWHF